MSRNQDGAVDACAPVTRDVMPPWWVSGIVGLGAALLGAGAVIALVHPAMLVSPHDQINDAARIYAGYFAARNLGLAILLLAALGVRAGKMLNSLMAVRRLAA